LDGKKTLEAFKTENDSLNKRNSYWGFKGYSGQMFFNILYNAADRNDNLTELNKNLKKVLDIRSDVRNRDKLINDFADFLMSFGEDYSGNKRYTPNPRYLLYFVSYFWQILDPEKYPIYYIDSMIKSMITLKLIDFSILTSTNYSKSYSIFEELNKELVSFYFGIVGDRKVNLWFIEHVFYNYKESQNEEQIEEPEKGVEEEVQFSDSQIISSLLDRIKQLEPKQFEQLCVDFLQSLGYGAYSPDSGEVTGRPNDGGIDGVIKGDELGFDNIYIQSKRWTSRNVNESEVQRFVGSIEGRGGEKGVFITASDYRNSAKEFVDHLRNNIKVILINGNYLAESMHKKNLGVRVVKTIERKNIDESFFNKYKQNQEEI
jgi:HJR/Mrr/RecB family endonuclease